MARLSEKIGYGFGDMASSMFWKIFSFFLPFFYSNIFGLSLIDAGMLMLVTRVWDAVSDPMMGIICDRTHTRWGKYRPYLLWIAIPFAVCGVMLFTTPDTGYGFKLFWAYFTYILMMTCYTAINVPYGAMLDVVTTSSQEKTVFSSYRMFFAYAGSFMALLAWEPLCGLFNGTGASTPIEECGPRAWTLAMTVIGGVCCVLFVLCFLLTREVVDSRSKASVGKDFRTLLTNKPWWIMNGVAIFNNFYNIIRGSAVAYLFANIIGGSHDVKILTFALTFMVSLLVIIATSVAFWFCPATTGGIWAMVGLQVVFAVALGVVSPLVWSMYADVANYSELTNGSASTGLIFSSASMAQKFGSAFGGAAVMWLLSGFGYDTAPGAVQPQIALDGIMAMMSLIPAGLALVAFLLLWIYPLTSERMDQIMAELKAMRMKPADGPRKDDMEDFANLV